MKKAFLMMVLLLANFSAAGFAQGSPPWYSQIEEATGLKGTYNEKEDVFKVSFPRTDLEVRVNGTVLTPPQGLTAWAAFKNLGDHVMVMGDMVVLEDQANPVMDAALNHGLEVTALHNHFFWDSPKVMFMHIGGMGKTEDLAASAGEVFRAIKETSGGKGSVPSASPEPSKTTLDPEALDAILGVKGELKDGVYKMTVGRTTVMSGHEMGNAMGVNTWAAFAGSEDLAVVDGDFAMLESELQDVLKALRKADIDIVAIHNHMTGETPRIMFLHYWGVGKASELAQGLKSALEKTNHQ